MTGDVFTAHFPNCQFDETIFPPLGGDKIVPEERIVPVEQSVTKERRELTWNTSTLSHLDPRTSQCENEVRRIVHLQKIANRLPDAFNDAAKVTKSHVPTMNAPARINVPVGQTQTIAAKESAIRQKHGRPIGSKDSAPRKRRNEQSSSCPPEEARNPPEEVMVKSVLSRIMEVPDETLKAPEEAPVPDNEEISILYNYSRERWNLNDDDWDTEPRSINPGRISFA